MQSTLGSVCVAAVVVVLLLLLEAVAVAVAAGPGLVWLNVQDWLRWHDCLRRTPIV